MGWLSFLKRKEARKDRPARPAMPADVVAQARTKARQRLIGAVVLLGVGIIGFPLLFETQPRPIPVDIPIEIPRKEGAAPLVMPIARPAHPAASPDSAPAAAQNTKPPVITEPAEEAKPSAPPMANAAASKAQAASPKAEAAPVPALPAAKPVPPPVDATRVQALLDGKSGAVEEGRFVVQVGAFAESAAARDTRAKVEKLGLKTYTQVVETSSGKRIRVRVGPFASRDQAAQAAEKIKAAGLPTAVLPL
jgi:DedD protein